MTLPFGHLSSRIPRRFHSYNFLYLATIYTLSSFSRSYRLLLPYFCVIPTPPAFSFQYISVSIFFSAVTETEFRFPLSPLTEADECPGPQDGGRWFLCSEGRCISSHLLCDFHPDCLHGDDETDCGKECCFVVLLKTGRCVIFIVTVQAEESTTVCNAFGCHFILLTVVNAGGR